MVKKVYSLGADIGGTFTDFALLNSETGQIQIYKCLTTPRDPSMAIEAGIKEMSKRFNIPDLAGQLDEVIHGTTIVINAIIERKGAKTGLITTKGFKDILTLRRAIRYDVYDIFAEYPEPLVPRPLREEVLERIASDGRILEKLEKTDVKRALQKLKSMGIESLAVSLLNSFENPVHELMIEDIVAKQDPDLFISISSKVLPEIREYERTSTTVANAYVKPLTEVYLMTLDKRLKSSGFSGKLYIMLSAGGISAVQTAAEFPVRSIESGPAAGVIAGEFYGRIFGLKDLFAFDMGGTTAKSCLIQRGRAGRVSTFEVGRVQRFKKGSGLPIQVPVIDLMEIGAGGGSIAQVSKMGLLQVGPESAGAAPGPVCYSLGGIEPTVTDSDLVLGYLDTDYFLGGEMGLDKQAAQRAIEERLAKPLGISLVRAAWGVHDVINETMATAAKTHISERGGDPRLLTIVAYGGAGPVHAYSLAKKIGSSQILVPPMPGVGSSFGFFTAPISFDVVRSHKVPLVDADFAQLEGLFREMEKDAKSVLEKSEKRESITYERSIDMRFIGQGWEVSTPLPDGCNISNLTKEEVRRQFDERYQLLYGRAYPTAPVEFVTFRLRGGLPGRNFSLPKIKKAVTSIRDCIKGKRLAYSALAQDFVPHAVYNRYKLFPGAYIKGPAIIEERESTTVVGADASVSVDDYGCIWIQLKEGKEQWSRNMTR